MTIIGDIPAQLVDCIATGRDPTIDELFTQAERIWRESATERPAFAWARLAPASAERVGALRAAQAALSGAEPT